MKFQGAVASTISTTVGLSALGIDAKTNIVSQQVPQRQARSAIAVDAKEEQAFQRKMGDFDRELKNFARINGAIENALKPISGSAVSSNELSDQQGTDSLDIGILRSNANPHHQPDYRQLQVDKDEAPLSYAVEGLCGNIEVLESYGLEICTLCGSYPSIDGAGNYTGEYYVELNCPFLATYNSNQPALGGFQAFCKEGHFCPDCEPVCPSCSFDADNFDVSLQNCTITNEMREIIRNYSPEEAMPAEPVVEEAGTEEEGSSNAESKANSTMVNSLVSLLFAGAWVWWTTL